MKTLMTIAALVISLSAAEGAKPVYETNDGTPPGTFTDKTNQKIPNPTTSASPVTSETGVTNSSGLSTEEINPSANPAPSTDQEVIENTTLSNRKYYNTGPFTRKGEFDPQAPVEEIEAQEEGPLDYSTTPDRKPTKPAEIKDE